MWALDPATSISSKFLSKLPIVRYNPASSRFGGKLGLFEGLLGHAAWAGRASSSSLRAGGSQCSCHHHVARFSGT